MCLLQCSMLEKSIKLCLQNIATHSNPKMASLLRASSIAKISPEIDQNHHPLSLLTALHTAQHFEGKIG